MDKGSHLGDVRTDLIDKRFGSFVVLDEFRRIHYKSGTKIQWKCRCDCGNEYYVDRGALLKRKVNYCSECRPKGIRHTKLYHIYHGIKQRCYNPKAPGYHNYGGKGVRMCDEWLADYNVFKVWSLEHGYIPDVGLSIDRIDSNGNYCPQNCQWIPLGENSAKSNYGRQMSHTKLLDVYAISPDGVRVDIDNIYKFGITHDLNVSSVNAALRGRRPNTYHGWKFHSNKSRQ